MNLVRHLPLVIEMQVSFKEKFIVICIIISSNCNSIVSLAKKVVCYFGSWAKYRPGRGQFDVENIDPHICTHLIFGFAGLRAGQNTIYALGMSN